LKRGRRENRIQLTLHGVGREVIERIGATGRTGTDIRIALRPKVTNRETFGGYSSCPSTYVPIPILVKVDDEGSTVDALIEPGGGRRE